jgi:hypothetical protein
MWHKLNRMILAAAMAAVLLISVSKARADIPLANELDVAQFYTQNEDPSQLSPFQTYPYASAASSWPSPAWVPGLRDLRISSFYPGIVENLTLQVYSATGLNYAPTRIGLNTVDQTALYQLSQPIIDPEKILIVASEGGDKAYFRMDILPGDVDQSGTVNTIDVGLEDFYLSPPPTDPYDIVFFDMNGDGVVDINDENFIQARIDAGKISLPDQPINVPEPSTAWLLVIAAASFGEIFSKLHFLKKTF